MAYNVSAVDHLYFYDHEINCLNISYIVNILLLISNYFIRCLYFFIIILQERFHAMKSLVTALRSSELEMIENVQKSTKKRKSEGGNSDLKRKKESHLKDTLFSPTRTSAATTSFAPSSTPTSTSISTSISPAQPQMSPFDAALERDRILFLQVEEKLKENKVVQEEKVKIIERRERVEVDRRNHNAPMRDNDSDNERDRDRDRTGRQRITGGGDTSRNLISCTYDCAPQGFQSKARDDIAGSAASYVSQPPSSSSSYYNTSYPPPTPSCLLVPVPFLPLPVPVGTGIPLSSPPLRPHRILPHLSLPLRFPPVSSPLLPITSQQNPLPLPKPLALPPSLPFSLQSFPFTQQSSPSPSTFALLPSHPLPISMTHLPAMPCDRNQNVPTDVPKYVLHTASSGPANLSVDHPLHSMRNTSSTITSKSSVRSTERNQEDIKKDSHNDSNSLGTFNNTTSDQENALQTTYNNPNSTSSGQNHCNNYSSYNTDYSPRDGRGNGSNDRENFVDKRGQVNGNFQRNNYDQEGGWARDRGIGMGRGGGRGRAWNNSDGNGSGYGGGGNSHEYERAYGGDELRREDSDRGKDRDRDRDRNWDMKGCRRDGDGDMTRDTSRGRVRDADNIRDVDAMGRDINRGTIGCTDLDADVYKNEEKDGRIDSGKPKSNKKEGESGRGNGGDEGRKRDDRRERDRERERGHGRDRDRDMSRERDRDRDKDEGVNDLNRGWRHDKIKKEPAKNTQIHSSIAGDENSDGRNSKEHDNFTEEKEHQSCSEGKEEGRHRVHSRSGHRRSGAGDSGSTVLEMEQEFSTESQPLKDDGICKK